MKDAFKADVPQTIYWDSDICGYDVVDILPIIASGLGVDRGYSTSFNEGPVGEVQYLLRSSPGELCICRKIVGFSTAKQMATFFFLEGSLPPMDFQKKKVIPCLAAENPTILLQVINSI